MALSFSYSSGVRLCFLTNSGVMAGSVINIQVVLLNCSGLAWRLFGSGTRNFLVATSCPRRDDGADVYSEQRSERAAASATDVAAPRIGRDSARNRRGFLPCRKG